MASKPAKTWVFTINNYNDNHISMLRSFDVKKMLVSKEVGESGTPHLQGAVTWCRAYRLTQLKKLIPSAHWEVAKALDCFNYCAKEGSEVIIEVDNGEQGKRTDWDAVKEMIKDGASYKMIAEAAPNLVGMNYKGIEKLGEWLKDDRPIMRKRCDRPKEVYWLWGPTGTGKSTYINDKHGYDGVWESSNDLQWFDGYNGERVVVFDDFRGDACKFSWLLRVLDRHPLRVPIKGGFTDWIPEIIYITSSKGPQDTYNPDMFDYNEKIEQLMRRIKEVKKFEKEDLGEVFII